MELERLSIRSQNSPEERFLLSLIEKRERHNAFQDPTFNEYGNLLDLLLIPGEQGKKKGPAMPGPFLKLMFRND